MVGRRRSRTWCCTPRASPRAFSRPSLPLSRCDHSLAEMPNLKITRCIYCLLFYSLWFMVYGLWFMVYPAAE